jgi:galactokinase
MIDFFDPQNPVVTPINAELSGVALCVVDTGGSHADLTPDYAAIPPEMKTVAAYFGKEYLRDVAADEFYAEIPHLRHLDDRALLRAIHFFGENERVARQAAALAHGDMKIFLELVIESGRSSLGYLQNVFSPTMKQQALTLALALSERILAGKGAWRVHGGGFAGTILAFVPDELTAHYRNVMDSTFGNGSCHFLTVRKEGGMEVEE